MPTIIAFHRELRIAVYVSLLLMPLFLYQMIAFNRKPQLTQEEKIAQVEADFAAVGECQWKMRTLAYMLRQYALTHDNRLPQAEPNVKDDQRSWYSYPALPKAQSHHLHCDRDKALYKTYDTSYRFNTALYGLSFTELKRRKNEVLLYEIRNNHGNYGHCRIFVSSLFKDDPNDLHFPTEQKH